MSIKPFGNDETFTREELLRVRDEDAERIRAADPRGRGHVVVDPKGRKQAVTARCMHCKTVRGPVVVDYAAWQVYVGGELVQSVFPKLSRERRDILIGGRTGKYLCLPCSVKMQNMLNEREEE